MNILETYSSYDDLALDLLNLENDSIDGLILLILMHSDLERLEGVDLMVQNVISNYSNLKHMRDERKEIV